MPLLLWCILGSTLVTASANSINCIWDKDIDS
jgi:heme O synthase-like polyprenyltransferase